MLSARALPVAGAGTLNTAFLKFTALQADASLVARNTRQEVAFHLLARHLSLKDYDPNLQSWNTWVRLHEKGGKFHEVPAHRKAEEYLTLEFAGGSKLHVPATKIEAP